MAKLRVLICSQYFDPEPGWRGLNLATWLQRHGCEVEVLTAIPNYPLGKIYTGYSMRWCQEEEKDGIRIIRVPLYPSHDRSGFRRIITYISFTLSALIIGAPRTRKADIVYVYNLPTVALIALWLKIWRGTPYVLNVADIWPDSVTQSGMLRKGFITWFFKKAFNWWLNHVVYRRAAFITVISQGFKRILVERGVPADKVSVVFNWADDDLFRPVAADEKLRRELGFAGHFNFVYAGNIGAMQGVETLIRAAKLLDSRDNKIQIVIVGTGQSLGQIKQLAGDLKLRNVKFLDWREQRKMLSIYAISDVLIVHLRALPLFAATIPGKTQVSLAVGRPILMAVAGECQEIILQANAGMVCEPENERTMADLMVKMATLDHFALKSMGDNGRLFYEREMSESVGAQRALDALRHAAESTQ